MRVLIVEDDPIIVEGLKIALSQEQYEVEAFGTVKEVLEAIKEEVHFAVCLLDVNLPDGDGYTVCRAIREKSRVPIIFLTACDDEIHTVLALEQGADDYISKPFRIRELIARIKAVVRRSGSNDNAGTATESNTQQERDTEVFGRCELDIRSGKVKRDGEEIFLSAVEYKLLLIFVKNRGHLLTRQNILNDMWDSAGDFVNDNTLTVYVRRLRKKLEAEGDEPVIATVRGIGYRMD
jgi:DNA-binding response OmpR family regulator